MLYSDDAAKTAALDAALASGRECNIAGFRFVVDWQRDGTYRPPYNDLSGNVDSATIDRQLTGNYPPEAEITDGYASAQMTVTISGATDDGIPWWRMFSPFSGEWPGQVGAINTPVQFGVYIDTTTGPQYVHQFTGFMLNSTPSRANGTVEITIGDLASQLTQPITLLPYARPIANAQDPSGDQARLRGGNSLSWYVNHIARQCGVMAGPPFPSTAVAACTLTGGALQEVGSMAQLPRDGRQSTDDPTMANVTYAQRPRYDDAPRIDSPTTYSYGMYGAGPFGPMMKPNIYEPSKAFVSGTKPDTMLWTGVTTVPLAVSTVTATSSRKVCLGGWIMVDPTLAAGNACSTMAQVIIDGVEHALSYPSVPYLQMNVDARTGAATAFFQGTNNNTRTVQGITVPAGWHYVALVFEFQTTDVKIRWRVDDQTTTGTWVGGSQGAYTGTAVYAWDNTGKVALETNKVTFSTQGNAQHWAVTYTSGALNYDGGLFNYPYSYTPLATSNIGTSYARVMWTPDTQGVAAWDVLKAIGSADLGAITVDEFGVLTYISVLDIDRRQDVAKPMFRLSLDDVAELDPRTRFESVFTVIKFVSEDKYSVDDVVFKTTDINQLAMPANSTVSAIYTIDDAMAILPGRVTWQPLAQGYGTGYTWQDIMRGFTPDFFKSGFTCHAFGSYTKADQPVKGTGVNAFVQAGWRTNGTDPRKITIYATNAAATQMFFAVDDNTPFLHVRGFVIDSAGKATSMVQNDDAISHFGSRVLTRPESDWASDYYSQYDLSQYILRNVSQARPFFDNVDVPADPRRQLADCGRIDDAAGVGGPVNVTIVGINRKFTVSGGMRETLTLRTFGNRSGAWILGDDGYSVLGTSTILTAN